jgi:hypothetical protein
MTETWSIVIADQRCAVRAGVLPIAWDRAPAWRAADTAGFRADFAHTLRRMDQLQPALSVLCLVSSVGFALSASGTRRALAAVSAACFVAVSSGSGLVSFPFSAALSIPTRTYQPQTSSDSGRAGCGHLLRTIVALVAFVLLVVAAVA